MNKFTPSLKLTAVFLLSALFGLSGCSEYWWTRGQPPSSSELLQRASEKVEISLRDRASARPDIAALAIDVQKSLSNITDSSDRQSLITGFSLLENSLKNLEGKLSYGNRPSLLELSGQNRAILADLSNPNHEVNNNTRSGHKLFLSRVLNFFSNELNVPSPDPVNIG